MASLGAACARVYVMQKHQEEKMKRIEEEKVLKRDEREEKKYVDEDRKVGSACTNTRKNKVHPDSDGRNKVGSA
ncbi:hypothetical protein HS088_TW05G00147 [Tripterygium wilfordii]|uniref:Uncharacterized protein n=1 Tax=Tripterygium wilfordii TaxID=458696 RepID=A0A7J7DMW8_TRIWF|nr:hypothetical protein HS088_TW05G00147 [Tripterygium wilfordii]